MHMLTLSEIDRYIKDRKDTYTRALQELESKIIAGRDRDKNPIPIYLTKHRIKKPSSAFLKLIHKEATEMNVLNDIAAIRVLCLFNQDLFVVYDFLLKEIFSNITISTIKIYNFSSNDSERFIQHSHIKNKINLKQIDNKNIIVDHKGSGYRSVHFVCKYIIGGENITIELQLRTLLQDVWGELEHALAYKEGAVSHHIQRYFRWLHEDLDGIGRFLAEMQEDHLQERSFTRFLSRTTKPNFFLWYELEIMPSQFSQNPILKETVDKYLKLSQTKNDNHHTHAKEATSLLQEIKNYKINSFRLDEINDAKLQYWIKMETAYWLYYQAEFNNAKDIYIEIINNKILYGEHYVAHFRLGEIYIILQDNIRALEQFQLSNYVLTERYANNIPFEVSKNYIKIKMKLSFIYWRFGRAYLSVSLREIKQAKQTFDSVESRYEVVAEKEFDANGIKNNLCWFLLEAFLEQQSKEEDHMRNINNQSERGMEGQHGSIASLSNEKEKVIGEIRRQTDQAYESMMDALRDLTPFLNSDNVDTQALDTGSWAYYQSYQYKQNPTHLEMAVFFCQKIFAKKSRSTLHFLTADLQQSHIKAIMKTAESQHLI